MNARIPPFRSEEEERAYWSEVGVVEYHGSAARGVAVKGGLRPSGRTICLRLPGAMLEELRVQANLMDVPPHFLMKTYLAERIEREMRKERSG